jgi:hypothetical protein
MMKALAVMLTAGCAHVQLHTDNCGEYDAYAQRQRERILTAAKGSLDDLARETERQLADARLQWSGETADQDGPLDCYMKAIAGYWLFLDKLHLTVEGRVATLRESDDEARIRREAKPQLDWLVTYGGNEFAACHELLAEVCKR